MGWEARNGKGRYYTRSNRQGRRTVREYLGSGLYGEYWAQVDADARAARAKRAEAARAEVDELAELGKFVAAYVQNVKAAAHDALAAAGYQRHQRGEWRKTRAQA